MYSVSDEDWCTATVEEDTGFDTIILIGTVLASFKKLLAVCMEEACELGLVLPASATLALGLLATPSTRIFCCLRFETTFWNPLATVGAPALDDTGGCEMLKD